MESFVNVKNGKLPFKCVYFVQILLINVPNYAYL